LTADDSAGETLRQRLAVACCTAAVMRREAAARKRIVKMHLPGDSRRSLNYFTVQSAY
jgi:hypothetical protein